MSETIESPRSEITRLQSALTEAQAEKEVMRDRVADMVGLIQLIEGRDDLSPSLRMAIANSHRYKGAKETLQSTPPTDVARVIEAARSARVLIDVLAEWERQNGSLDAGLVFPNDGKSLVETINARAEPGTGFRPLSEALAGLDGGRKG